MKGKCFEESYNFPFLIDQSFVTDSGKCVKWVMPGTKIWKSILFQVGFHAWMNLCPFGFSAGLALVGSFVHVNFTLLAMKTTQHDVIWLGSIFLWKWWKGKIIQTNLLLQCLTDWVRLLACCCKCWNLYSTLIVVLLWIQTFVYKRPCWAEEARSFWRSPK